MPDRIIKESICTSDTLNQLKDFEERFWHRLTVNCDDYGRFDARPAILKGRLFPLMDSKTHKDMLDALSKLASVGLVEIYEVDGKPFLQVAKWEKHQRIRAKRSKFPPPSDTCRQLPSIAVNSVRNPIQSESESESESKRAQARKRSGEQTVIPEELEPEFSKYVEMRKSIKSPMTEYAKHLALLELEKLAPGDIEKQKLIINQSIMNSWKGLFELKNAQPAGKRGESWNDL